MKTLLASVLALSLFGATAANAYVGIQVGPIGVGVGHYHWHNHYWHHRARRHGQWHYW